MDVPPAQASLTGDQRAFGEEDSIVKERGDARVRFFARHLRGYQKRWPKTARNRENAAIRTSVQLR
jgi:hypothetical protein